MHELSLSYDSECYILFGRVIIIITQCFHNEKCLLWSIYHLCERSEKLL